MALFDKVKSQAQDVAKRAQEATKVGQAKLDEFQSKRQLDSLYRDLGEAVYAERTGVGSPGSVDVAVAAITAHLQAASEAASAAGASSSAAPTSPGAPTDGGMPSGSYSSSTDEEPNA
jgi:hypothetical protein